MRSFLERLPANLPEVALLLEPPCALGLRVVRSRGGAQVVARAEEAIEWEADSTLAPERLRGLADRICTALGAPPRLSVVLGDSLVRMQVMTLTDFPAGEEERLQVIRWHVRKVLNFNLEDQRVRYQILEKGAGAVTLWLTLCRESLAQEIEASFAAAGCHVGFLGAVGPELFNLASRTGALPPEGTLLLLSRTERSVSFLFVQDGTPRYYRCKDLRIEDGGEEAQLAQEIRLTLAYHHDRMGGTPLGTLLVRKTAGGLTLPLRDEVDEGVLVADLAGSAGAPAGLQGPVGPALPLLSVLGVWA